MSARICQRVSQCLALLLCVPVAGIAAADTKAEGLVGNWISQLDGLALTIRADGSFRINPPGGKRPPVTGTWEEDEGTVVFRNDSDAAVCKDVPGRYRWQTSDEGTLRFALVEDDCQPRTAHMKRPFEPAPLKKR